MDTHPGVRAKKPRPYDETVRSPLDNFPIKKRSHFNFPNKV
ncbi:hypothetical protein [Planktothrix sp. FACHB-1365]|nr:hypothetical protein [Planktothrix sp. FACHB-1365]